jgi:hypothetical protein
MPEGGTHEETLAIEDTPRENDRLIKDNDSRLDHIRARNGSHPGHECAWKVGRRFGGGRYSVLWCSHKFLGKQFIQLLKVGNPCRRRSRSQHRGCFRSIIRIQTSNPTSSSSILTTRTSTALLRWLSFCLEPILKVAAVLSPTFHMNAVGA